jgi:outer membrane protein assembly factor BamB
MKFYRIISIGEVETFPDFNDREGLMYKTNYDLVSISKEGKMELLLGGMKYGYPFFIKEDEIHFYIEGSIYKLNIQNKNLETVWQSKIGRAVILKNLIFDRNYNESSDLLDLYCYDLNAKELLWYKTYKGVRFINLINNKIFLSDLVMLKLIQINELDGSIIWSIDFGYDVIGDIFTWNDLLIVKLRNDTITGVNSQTGQRVWEIKNVYPHYVQDTKAGLIYGFGRSSYQIIDPVKGKILFEKDMYEQCGQYDIAPHGCNISGDGLYFINNISDTKLGKLNIRTHQIEFVQDLDTKPGVKVSRANFYQGRFYILDTDHTLHVFEEIK